MSKWAVTILNIMEAADETTEDDVRRILIERGHITPHTPVTISKVVEQEEPQPQIEK